MHCLLCYPAWQVSVQSTWQGLPDLPSEVSVSTKGTCVHTMYMYMYMLSYIAPVYQVETLTCTLPCFALICMGDLNSASWAASVAQLVELQPKSNAEGRGFESHLWQQFIFGKLLPWDLICTCVCLCLVCHKCLSLYHVCMYMYNVHVPCNAQCTCTCTNVQCTCVYIQMCMYTYFCSHQSFCLLLFLLQCTYILPCGPLPLLPSHSLLFFPPLPPPSLPPTVWGTVCDWSGTRLDHQSSHCLHKQSNVHKQLKCISQ